ncbi:MAG: FAD-dependent oxidoreductase [Succinivibrio sp.]|nr:FAD-dependent oxidoreductase [Succinivibrio sp.]
MLAERIKCDTVVIGAGSAGIEAFRQAQKAGSDCILVVSEVQGLSAKRKAEIPTSILMSAGLSMHRAKRMHSYGIETTGEVSYDTTKVLQNLRVSRTRSSSEVLSFMYKIPLDKLLMGKAAFIDQHSLSVNDQVVIFKSAVICTGSSPRVTFEQSRLPGILNVDRFFDQDMLPKSAAVFGSSSQGLLLGQALSYLGVEVMVFGQQRLWELTDEDVLQEAKQLLKERFSLVLDSFITSIEADSNGYAIYYLEDKFENFIHSDTVVAATGRFPNVAGMNLQDIGIKLARSGHILVDEKTLQTSVPHIFAAGDVVHEIQSTTLAQAEGRIAGDNAAHFPALRPEQAQPVRIHIVYTDPVLAMVGASLQELLKRSESSGQQFVTGKVRMDDFAYRARHEEEGIICLYVDSRSHALLGAELCGSGADHIAQFLAMAIQKQFKAEDLANFVFYHMSCESVIGEACRRALQQL